MKLFVEQVENMTKMNSIFYLQSVPPHLVY
jgi:hypothetical protein